MGRVRNLRLPDEMEDDVDKYLSDNRVKFTDLVINGITSIIYQESKKQPANTFVAPVICSVTSPGDTVYVQDDVKPTRKPKQSISKQVQPAVNTMLQGIRKQVLVEHHPQCKCAMCIILKG